MIILAAAADITRIGWWFPDQITAVDVISTVQNGGRVRFNFTGTALSVQMQTTESDIEYSIDGGAFTRVDSAPNIVLAAGLTDTSHTCEIYTAAVRFDSGVRWTDPSGPAYESFTIVDGNTITAWPTGNSRTMLVLGDSIAEGLNTYTGGTTTNNTEGRLCFTNQLAALLGLDCVIHGFGGTSITAGAWTVPKAIDALPYAMNGVAAPVDLTVRHILIEHGNNDRNATSVDFTAGYEALIDAARATYPNAYVHTMTPWPGYSTIVDHMIDVRAISASKNTTLIDLATFPFDMAFAQHPTVAEATQMAEIIEPIITAATIVSVTNTSGPVSIFSAANPTTPITITQA